MPTTLSVARPMINCLVVAMLAACGGGGAEPDAEPFLQASAQDAGAAAPATLVLAARATAAGPVPVAPDAQAPQAATAADAAAAAPAPQPFTPPSVANAGAPAPVVFNASRSARAGDIISLQGEDFGTAPIVWLEALGSTPLTALNVLNQVGTGWIAVQIPASATGALALRVSNGTNTSARILLNAAAPHHLDATQIVPGGAFRLLGRNLLLPGSTPSVTVDGLPATLDLAASDEHLLVLKAPAGLRASSAAAIAVDNGNGTGSALLERKVAVVTGASGDPLGLGVGWSAGFAPLMARSIDAAKDGRLASRVVCDGKTDDSAAIKAALVFASRNGGGVVQLPAGVCVLTQSVQLFSNTVLQGAGKDRTELLHTDHSPIHANKSDLLALRHFTLSNVGVSAGSSLNLKNNTRLVVQGVRVNEGASAMAWMYGNTDIAVVDSEFLQTGGQGTGATILSDNHGLVFVGNRIGFLNNTGSSFDTVSDAYIQGNTWVRDAIRQNEPGICHVVSVNFARRIAIIGNRFDVINGPVDPAKNDGETILTEGGGATRTEGLGQVASATAHTLHDPGARLNPNVLVNGKIPDNFGISIVAGKGAGQSRRVLAFDAGSFTVDRAWDVQPDAGSRYATAVWGLEQALIKGNELSNNPRGILLYFTAVRDVEITGNRLNENAGILVRTAQDLSRNVFQAAYNVAVTGNVIVNSTRRHPSYLSINFANADATTFGISQIGVEVRRNRLTANNPNIDATRYHGPAGREGYSNQMDVGTAAYTASPLPRILGTVMQGNTCTNCATAFRLSTGAHGSVLADNVLVDSGALWIDLATPLGSERSMGTVVR